MSRSDPAILNGPPTVFDPNRVGGEPGVLAQLGLTHRRPEVLHLPLGAENRDPALGPLEDTCGRKRRIVASLATVLELRVHGNAVDHLLVEMEQ